MSPKRTQPTQVITLAGTKGGLISAVARSDTKANRLKDLRVVEANAKQTGGNHNHKEDLNGESERAEPPQAAFEGSEGNGHAEAPRTELAAIVRKKGWT